MGCFSSKNKKGKQENYKSIIDNNKKIYKGEEDNIFCGKFPKQRMCGCTIPCRRSMKEVTIDKIHDGLFLGPI